jgi:hypothetical protein
LAAAADALEEIVAAVLDEGGELPVVGEPGPSGRLVPLGYCSGV